MNKKGSGFGKFLLGAGIGVSLGLLFAPKSGKETREDLKKKMDELLLLAKNIDVEEVKIYIENKVNDIKEDLKNIDKETVAETIKKESKKIKKKTDELVDYAVKKGTPVIENAAKEVKKSTVKALESITDRLKEEEPIKSTSKKNTKNK